MIQDSSLKAYYAIQSSLSQRQKQVFAALSSVSNATNRELTEMTGLRINEVTPRIMELRKRGVVVEACHRRCRQSGRTVIAWKSVAPSLPPAFEKTPAPENGSKTQSLFQ